MLTRTRLHRLQIILGMTFSLALGTSGTLRADAALRDVTLFDDGKAHTLFATDARPGFVERAFPFCPTDRVPCTPQRLAWVQLRASIDTYSVRRNDPHDSIANILAATRDDLAPLADALSSHFAARRVVSDVARVAFIHGLVTAVAYAKDTQTGWTEYPKFGLELLVDEQGDCDDAAIANTLLLAALGYRSYFVNWDGPAQGHVSTAIEPDRGDLRAFAPPTGSLWVEAAGLPPLLHVDATGIPEGCGKAWVNCGALGFNEWHKKGLKLEAVVAADDPAIATKLPLSAWNNGGRDRPDRQVVDRRGSTDQEIQEALSETEQREQLLRRRLAGAGIDPSEIEVYLRSTKPYDPLTFYTFITACAAIVLFLIVSEWRRRRRRRQRVVESRARRQDEDFLS
ncbi:MAG: hypothetical protein HC897_01895 [Thermoanaerobaculia bacterium]|nr:hypothetical protein [Thermoanaerobaculia bacterium]